MATREELSGQSLALELFSGLSMAYECALDVATLYQDRRWKRWVAEMAGPLRGARVLDAGCGTLVLEERFLPPGCRVVGLDLTEEMLAVGRSKRLPSVDGLFNGDAEYLPFADSSFDVAVSCYVAKYVDLGRFASELARVVKPGGKVVVYDFVSPRGAFGILLLAYLYGVIGPAGRILGMVRSKSAVTFQKLPMIVRRADWDLSMPQVSGSLGLQTVASESLTKGVVTAFSFRKPIGNG